MAGDPLRRRRRRRGAGAEGFVAAAAAPPLFFPSLISNGTGGWVRSLSRARAGEPLTEKKKEVLLFPKVGSYGPPSKPNKGENGSWAVGIFPLAGLVISPQSVSKFFF
jgi:hypothetical protein